MYTVAVADIQVDTYLQYMYIDLVIKVMSIFILDFITRHDYFLLIVMSKFFCLTDSGVCVWVGVDVYLSSFPSCIIQCSSRAHSVLSLYLHIYNISFL